jgi:hypothetical protein
MLVVKVKDIPLLTTFFVVIIQEHTLGDLTLAFLCCVDLHTNLTSIAKNSSNCHGSFHLTFIIASLASPNQPPHLNLQISSS